MSDARNRKLKIWATDGTGTVYVVQDGSAADADATAGRKFDDGIRGQAQPPNTTATGDRESVTLRTLRRDIETGSEFQFSTNGRKAWHNGQHNALRIQPGFKVEFFAEVPDKNTAITSPSWHLNQQTTGAQVRWFLGWASDVSLSPEGGVEVTCKGPEWRANDVILTRNTQAGIDIPKIALNLPIDHADEWQGIKIIDNAATPPWGTGNSKHNDSRMTVAQILDYLRTAYNARLITEGVLDAAVTGKLFTDADIAPLTQKAGPIVLEKTGFYEGVRQILQQFAPELRIIVDHRTTQWRLVTMRSLMGQHDPAASQLLRVLSQPYKARVSATTVGMFSATPGADGNRLRVYERDDPSLNEELTIHSIVGSELRFVEVPVREYNADSRLAPIHAAAASNLSIDVAGAEAGSLQIGLDTDGVYSAVQIMSVNQKTTTESIGWNRMDLNSGPLQPGWQTGFEAVWKDADAERELDTGDGDGMRVYKRDESGGNVRLYISFHQSHYGNDHVADEWNGCSVWIWKLAGANVRNAHTTFAILDTETVLDVGDGTPGLRITLNGTSQAGWDAYGFQEVVDAGSDRIVLTHDKRFSTTTRNNARSEVGRKWYLTDTAYAFDNSTSPHVSACTPLKLWTDDGFGGVNRHLGMTPGLGYPARNRQTDGPWEVLATGGLGAHHVWRRATYSHKPAGVPCPGGAGWQPPKLVMLEIERTTTTVRSTRYPSSGYQGEAFLRYGLSRVLYLTAAKWDEDAQDADYAAIALRTWEAVHHAHHRGSVALIGIKENAIWFDLATRVSFRHSLMGASEAGAVNGFWGFLGGVELDFQAQRVTFEFDNGGALTELALATYEDGIISEKADRGDIYARLVKLGEQGGCMAGSQWNMQPKAMCGERIFMPGGTPLPPHVRRPGKDNQANGLSTTGVGIPEGGGREKTHGPGATDTVFQDLEGAYFGIGGMGQIYAGSVAGNVFTPSVGATGQPHGIPQRNQRVAAAMNRALGIYDMALETSPWILAVTKAGSTTTTIKIDSPILADDAIGGQAVFVKDGVSRPGYTVATIVGDTITLTAAMSAAAPVAGVEIVIVPVRKPIPNTADFPASAAAFGFKDAAGNWYVLQNGSVWRATSSGGLLSKVASGSGSLIMDVGYSAGNANVTVTNHPVGTWDFGDADVSGIGGGLGGGGSFDYGSVDDAVTDSQVFGFAYLAPESSADWGTV